MRKEHVPVEPKSFRPLDFQNDQNLFVRPSTPEKSQADMNHMIQSEPIPTFETELNSRIEHTEIISTLKETQEAIQQAIRLGESQIDDGTFKEFLQIVFFNKIFISASKIQIFANYKSLNHGKSNQIKISTIQSWLKKLKKNNQNDVFVKLK